MHAFERKYNIYVLIINNIIIVSSLFHFLSNGIHQKQKHVLELLLGAAHRVAVAALLGIPERRIWRGIQSRHSVHGHHAQPNAARRVLSELGRH